MDDKISREDSGTSPHTTEQSDPEPDPVCPKHLTELIYKHKHAWWKCPMKGCRYRALDPYEWDFDYEPSDV